MWLYQAVVFILLIVLAIHLRAAPDEFCGVVTKVVDGDTFDIDGLGRVRLADVDCPELDTPEGRSAANYTISWLFGRVVCLDLDDRKGKDEYGRWIAVVYLFSNGSSSPDLIFNKMIVDSGHAIVRDFMDNEFSPADWWDTGLLKPDGSCAYVGSAAANKYHYPDCKWAQKIAPSNLICFSSPADARSRGYIPCRVCKPP